MQYQFSSCNKNEIAISKMQYFYNIFIHLAGLCPTLKVYVPTFWGPIQKGHAVQHLLCDTSHETLFQECLIETYTLYTLTGSPPPNIWFVCP